MLNELVWRVRTLGMVGHCTRERTVKMTGQWIYGRSKGLDNVQVYGRGLKLSTLFTIDVAQYGLGYPGNCQCNSVALRLARSCGQR